MSAMDMVAQAGLGVAKARQAGRPAPQQVTPLKLCIDCKHYIEERNGYRAHVCGRFYTDLVHGHTYSPVNYCSEERSGAVRVGHRPACGPEGAHWEQK